MVLPFLYLVNALTLIALLFTTLPPLDLFHAALLAAPLRRLDLAMSAGKLLSLDLLLLGHKRSEPLLLPALTSASASPPPLPPRTTG